MTDKPQCKFGGQILFCEMVWWNGGMGKKGVLKEIVLVAYWGVVYWEVMDELGNGGNGNKDVRWLEGMDGDYFFWPSQK